MCNQKWVTNKTYKRNTQKQLSSCLNRTPVCGGLSQGRKQIFPLCVWLVSSEGESCTSNNRITSEQFDSGWRYCMLWLYELNLGQLAWRLTFLFPITSAKVKRLFLVVLKIMLILREHRECGSPSAYYLQLQKGISNSSISRSTFSKWSL